MTDAHGLTLEERNWLRTVWKDAVTARAIEKVVLAQAERNMHSLVLEKDMEKVKTLQAQIVAVGAFWVTLDAIGKGEESDAGANAEGAGQKVRRLV